MPRLVRLAIILGSWHIFICPKMGIIQPKVIVLRTPSDRTPNAIRPDFVRHPIGRRTENDDFWLNIYDCCPIKPIRFILHLE